MLGNPEYEKEIVSFIFLNIGKKFLDIEYLPVYITLSGKIIHKYSNCKTSLRCLCLYFSYSVYIRRNGFFIRISRIFPAVSDSTDSGVDS